MSSRSDMTLDAETGPRHHQLEFEPKIGREQGGEFRLSVDGKEAGVANWVRIAPGLYSILLDGRSYDVRVSPCARKGSSSAYDVRVEGQVFRVSVRDPRSRRQTSEASGALGPQEITAPMPGKIVKLLVAEGDMVETGGGLLVMEAMKMQNELRAPRAGRIERIYAPEGAGVETGAPLLQLA